MVCGEQGLIFAILILIFIFVGVLLYLNYNNQPKSALKELSEGTEESENVEQKGGHWTTQSLESYVALVTTAGELFSNYINTMNVNLVPIFQQMNKHSAFEHYIKYINKATNLLNSIISSVVILNDALSKPVLNNVLVNNMIYNIQQDIKDLYQQINYAQYESLCAIRYALKYGYIYDQYSINILNVITVQSDTHITIATPKYASKIREQYIKIVDKMSRGKCDKIIDCIENLYFLFCGNFQKWYKDNIDVCH